MRPDALQARLLAGHIWNVRFSDTQRFVEACGFELQRVSGSHHVYAHPDVQELLNLQEVKGQAKPYQLRQLLRLIERYRLDLEGDA